MLFEGQKTTSQSITSNLVSGLTKIHAKYYFQMLYNEMYLSKVGWKAGVKLEDGTMKM